MDPIEKQIEEIERTTKATFIMVFAIFGLCLGSLIGLAVYTLFF